MWHTANVRLKKTMKWKHQQRKGGYNRRSVNCVNELERDMESWGGSVSLLWPIFTLSIISSLLKVLHNGGRVQNWVFGASCWVSSNWMRFMQTCCSEPTGALASSGWWDWFEKKNSPALTYILLWTCKWSAGCCVCLFHFGGQAIKAVSGKCSNSAW